MVLDIRSLAPSQTKALLGKTKKGGKGAVKRSSSGDSAADPDSVKITGQAAQINQLIEQMKAEPVIDPDRISPVKEKLSAGGYKINYQQVANKMLDFESGYGGY